MRKNACGPNWMPRKLREIISGKFNASCIIHDLDYSTAKYTQKEADDRFLVNMLKQSKGEVRYIIVSGLYYLAVRVGGFLSYKKK